MVLIEVVRGAAVKMNFRRCIVNFELDGFDFGSRGAEKALERHAKEVVEGGLQAVYKTKVNYRLQCLHFEDSCAIWRVYVPAQLGAKSCCILDRKLFFVSYSDCVWNFEQCQVDQVHEQIKYNQVKADARKRAAWNEAFFPSVDE